MTTIREELLKSGCELKDSVYGDFNDSILDFKMAAVGDFSLVEKKEELENFKSWVKFYQLVDDKLNNITYKGLENKIKTLNEVNKELNEKARKIFLDGMEISSDERNKMQKVRKDLKTSKEEMTKIYDATYNILKDYRPGSKLLCYKKELLLNSYENIASCFEFIPVTSKMPYWNEMPFYTNNISGLKKAVENGEEIAVEGGPCLFGLQEVYVVITLSNGEKYKFDYNTAHYGPEDIGELGCESLESLVLSKGMEITDVSFIDQKKGLTRQEYYELLYPFELAKNFKAKLVIPLPDMSYKKYLTALCDHMREDVAKIAMERFCKVIYRIADLMLDKISEIEKEYPDVEHLIIHDRTEELKQIYYEGRSKFAVRSKSRDVIKGLTHNELRQQSIYDYVTMPALPLYLYGIKNVIQIDGMNEVDSHRKCRQIHNSNLNLSAMLYPEYLSQDGRHTVFYSKIEDKDYL